MKGVQCYELFGGIALKNLVCVFSKCALNNFIIRLKADIYVPFINSIWFSKIHFLNHISVKVDENGRLGVNHYILPG